MSLPRTTRLIRHHTSVTKSPKPRAICVHVGAGINVHLREGVDEATGETVKKVRYIEGNRDHPVDRGVLCAKGSAGIMQHYSPARLKAPMKRVGPRGSGQFEEISWDEALELATQWLAPLREEAPNKLAFFTGRDQSQSFTSLWAQSFGTPNYAAHGGFCSVNMATGGIYTLGGAFWEFGSPDWENTKLFMLFGVAEDHDSNPIKMGLGRLKERGAKTIAVNPVRTGYNAVADEWIGITPGTDGLFVLSLVHELVRTGKIDVEYLARYTNAAAVVVTQGDPAEMGLLARDAEGNVITQSSLRGVVDLGDGRQGRPVFELMVEKYLDPAYAPSAVAERCGIPASRIEAIAQELARVAFEEEIEIQQPWTDMHGVRHETMKGALLRCTRCAGLARTAMASKPAVQSTCYSCYWGRLKCQAVSASSLRTPSPCRRTPNRMLVGLPVSRWTVRIWALSGDQRTCCLKTMASHPSALTRRSVGTRRCRHMV